MKIEVWSDVVCPWCYIGKRRLEAALARFAHRDEVEVVWRSFELDPGAPRERAGDAVEHLATKYGTTREEAEAMQRRVTEAGAAEGLQFHLERSRRGNTLDAHRLLHLAAEHGLQGALQERLMRAYFSEGEPIGDPVALERLSVEAGLSPEAVRDALRSDRYEEAVRADERQARAFGANAVPFFVIDRTYGVAGAQPAEVFTAVLDKVWSERRPATIEAGESGQDGACAD